MEQAENKDLYWAGTSNGTVLVYFSPNNCHHLNSLCMLSMPAYSYTVYIARGLEAYRDSAFGTKKKHFQQIMFYAGPEELCCSCSDTSNKVNVFFSSSLSLLLRDLYAVRKDTPVLRENRGSVTLFCKMNVNVYNVLLYNPTFFSIYTLTHNSHIL